MIYENKKRDEYVLRIFFLIHWRKLLSLLRCEPMAQRAHELGSTPVNGKARFGVSAFVPEACVLPYVALIRNSAS